MPDAFGRQFAAQRGAWPDVVGFTSLTTQAHGAKDCIAQLRKAGAGGTVVVGGIHATTDAEEVMAWDGVDLVILIGRGLKYPASILPAASTLRIWIM